MSGWLALAIYAAGFLFTYRRIYLAIDSDHTSWPATMRGIGP